MSEKNDEHRATAANARLIAAAPEMLEVLEGLAEGLVLQEDAADRSTLSPHVLGWLSRARAAIAKARGESGRMSFKGCSFKSCSIHNPATGEVTPIPDTEDGQ